MRARDKLFFDLLGFVMRSALNSLVASGCGSQAMTSPLTPVQPTYAHFLTSREVKVMSLLAGLAAMLTAEKSTVATSSAE